MLEYESWCRKTRVLGLLEVKIAWSYGY